MAYIELNTTQIETRLVRYKCCLANSGYSLFKSEQNQTDNKGCLTNKFQYLNQGINTIERYLKKITPLQIYFDFSDLEDASYPITRTFQFYFNENKYIETIITASSYSNFLDEVLNLFISYQDQTELLPVLINGIIYLNLGCKICTSSEIMLIQGINSYWDLTDVLVNTSAYSFTVVRNDDSSTIVDYPIQSYSSLGDLINAVVNSINAEGNFFAYYSGNLIYLQSLTDPGINVELTLTLTNPFQIQVDPVYDPAPITFPIVSTTLDSGNASVYNSDDDTWWFIGSNNAGGGEAVIVITDSSGNTIISTPDSDYNNSFVFTRGVYDPNTKRIYVAPLTRISSGITGIAVIDADPLSGTYGEFLDCWAIDGGNIITRKLYIHSDGTLWCAGQIGTQYVISALDDAGNTLFSTSVGSTSEYDFNNDIWGSSGVQVGLNMVFTAKNRIIKIDGNSASGTYGDVLVDLLIDADANTEIGNIVDNENSLNFIEYGLDATAKIYEVNYALDSFFEVIDIPTTGTEAGRFLIFVNDLLFVSGQSFYALYDNNYNLLTYSHLEDVVAGDTPAIIYGAAVANDEKLFYNYFLTSYVGVFATSTTEFTYDLDIADIDISEFEAESVYQENEYCSLEQDDLQNVIQTLDGYCCDSCQDNLNLIKDIE